MKGSSGGINARLATTLLAFAVMALSFAGVQMNDGLQRAAVVLILIVLVTAVGAFAGLALVHREDVERGKDEWGKGHRHDTY